MFKIETDLNAVNKQLGTVLNVVHSERLLAYVGRRIGIAAESVVPEYPLVSGKPLPKIYQRRRKDGTTYLSKFKSQKQQGKVFMLLKQGKIPYRRTGQLGRSITSAIKELTNASVSVVIGTNTPYAPYVIGDDNEQALYHKGVWWQLVKVIERELPVINAEAQKATVDGIRRLLNGETL